MGRRRKEKLLDVLIRLPWWAGAGGALLILAIRPLWLAWAESGAGMFAPFMRQFANFFYLVAAVFAVGAVASLIRQWWHGRLLDRRAAFMDLGNSRKTTSSDNLHWRDFERILQEAFRRQGYLSVESPSGPDGGYDIALRKDGKRYLVQCKRWKSRQVGVAPARELWGVIAASKADGGFFVTSGSFTPDAQAFARDIELELIDGAKLERLLSKVTSNISKTERIEPNVTESPSCPKCGGEMVRRIAKKGANAGKEFWGCTGFPSCKGIVAG